MHGKLTSRLCHRHRRAEQRVASLAQVQTLGLPYKKRDAQPIFESLDLATQSGLTDTRRASSG
jgi:hypothetical protein